MSEKIDNTKCVVCGSTDVSRYGLYEAQCNLCLATGAMPQFKTDETGATNPAPATVTLDDVRKYAAGFQSAVVPNIALYELALHITRLRAEAELVEDRDLEDRLFREADDLQDLLRDMHGAMGVMNIDPGKITG